VSTAVDRAVDVLRAGGLVAFPTETVYGLGADARNAEAVRRLFAVKGRPPTHPVIAHLGARTSLDDWADAPNDHARALAAAFWPGPLTIVVTRRPGTIVDEVTGGRATVGLRVPDHPLALELLDECGVFAGISSGAAVAGASRVASRMESGTIVTLLPDEGWKYLSSGAWTDDLDVVEERAGRINYW